MIAPPPGVRVWLACGRTDMRKGLDGLSMLAQQVLDENPFDGALFAFRGRGGGLVKLLWYDGQGLCLFTKRLDRGHFVWPMTETGRADAGATVDVAGRHRLADAQTRESPRSGGMIAEIVT